MIHQTSLDYDEDYTIESPLWSGRFFMDWVPMNRERQKSSIKIMGRTPPITPRDILFMIPKAAR